MGIAVTDIPDDYPFAGSLAFDARRMKQLFDYGEHCALVDALWSTPIDALDQGHSQAPPSQAPPSQALLVPSEAVPCAGKSPAPATILKEATPKVAISKEIEAALPDAPPGVLDLAGH
jgi:hypothetical protein